VKVGARGEGRATETADLGMRMYLRHGTGCRSCLLNSVSEFKSDISLSCYLNAWDQRESQPGAEQLTGFAMHIAPPVLRAPELRGVTLA